jgi:hypothetical protein
MKEGSLEILRAEITQTTGAQAWLYDEPALLARNDVFANVPFVT